MNKLITKIVGATLGLAMAIGVGVGVAYNRNAVEVNAASFTSTLTFSSAPTSGESYNATQDDEAMATYTWQTDSEYISADTDGSYKSIHTGSSSKTCSYQKYTSSSFSSYLIKSVKFRAKSNGTNPSCAVTINGESVGSQSLTNSYQDLTISNTSEKQGGDLVVNFTINSAKKNIMVSYIQVVYEPVGGSNDPKISFSEENIDGEEGDDFSFTYTADNLTDNITWSPTSENTEVINYTVDTANNTVNGTMLKAGSVTLTATSGSVSDSVVINVAKHFAHRKYTVTATNAVSQNGDTITGSSASYSSTYGTTYQLTSGNSMTLSITGLTRKVSINKLVLSMRSNSGQGAGSVSVTIDEGTPSFIAGTSSTSGAGFNTFGDNNAYSTAYKNVTWDGLTYVAKSSIEIKIYCINTNSLYCQSFDLFFEETDNTDVVTELTVSPNSWTGFDSQVLQIEDFTVSVTTNGAAGTAVDYTFLGIGYMDGDTFAARDANFIYGNPKVADTRLCWKANYPTTAGGSTYLYAYVTLNVSEDTITSIVVSGNMDKTSYFTTDSWERYGLQSKAIFASGTEQVTTGLAEYSYYRDSAMTDEVATPADLGTGSNQTIYVKATYQGASNATGYAQTVSVSIEPGTQITDPLTADAAIAIGSTCGNNGETQKEYYIRGIVISVEVNQLDQEGSSKYATFDLEESDPDFNFKAYKITPNENCTNYQDLQVGAEVLLYCRIKNYKNTTIENGSVGELLSISYTAQALTGVSLDKTSLLIGAGDEQKLTASPVPLNADLGTVAWSTSDNSVATVDQNGNVGAVAPGSATITASAGGFETECVVTVAAVEEIDLTIDETTSASDNALVWNYPNEFTVEDAKGTGTKVTNYYPGTAGQSYTVTRFYANNIITITPDIKTNILQAVFSASADSHATKLASSNYTNASAVADGKDVIITVADPSLPFTITVGDKCDFKGIKVLYQNASAKEVVGRLDTQTDLAYRYQKDDGGNFTYSDIVMRFGAQISKDLWNELDTDSHVITGFGVILMDGEMVKNAADVADAMTDMALSTVSEDLSTYLAIDYFVPITNMNEKIGSNANDYFWNLRVSVDQTEMNKTYSAVAYIKVGDEYVLLNMARESVKTLASDYLANRNCDDTTAGGSLQNIVDTVA